MKITLLIMLALFPTLGRAMVFADSRVLSRKQMADVGVEIQVISGDPQKGDIQLLVEVLPTSEGRRYTGMAYSVLERAPDEDFASNDARKSGVRDARRWAKEIRGESTEKLVWSFHISKEELSRTYLVVRFHLPPNDGVPVFGIYYFLPRELKDEANKAADLTPSAGTSAAGQPRVPISAAGHL